jgi:replicative DNA helicase
MTHREFSAAIGTQFNGNTLWKRAPSREPLGRVATVLGSAELELLCTNDVFWDEIVEIESIGEQDADMVILLHRDDVYEKESARPGEADLIVAKHRNGPTRDIVVAFQGHYSRFVDMAH